MSAACTGCPAKGRTICPIFEKQDDGDGQVDLYCHTCGHSRECHEDQARLLSIGEDSADNMLSLVGWAAAMWFYGYVVHLGPAIFDPRTDRFAPPWWGMPYYASMLVLALIVSGLVSAFLKSLMKPYVIPEPDDEKPSKEAKT
jgi:hypothetical protein